MVFVAFPCFDMVNDISLFTRYIYFHPLNPLCERGREAGCKTEGASPKIDGLARDQIQRKRIRGCCGCCGWREGRCGILQTRSIPIRGWMLCEVLETYPEIWWVLRRHLSRLNAGSATIDAQYAPIGGHAGYRLQFVLQIQQMSSNIILSLL